MNNLETSSSSSNQEAFKAHQTAFIETHQQVEGGAALTGVNGPFSESQNAGVTINTKRTSREFRNTIDAPGENPLHGHDAKITYSATPDAGRSSEGFSAFANTSAGGNKITVKSGANRVTTRNGGDQYDASASIIRKTPEGYDRVSSFKRPENIKKAGDIITRMAQRKIEKATHIDKAA